MNEQQLFHEALSRFARARTAIIVAHRLATIERADEVLVLEGGRVVEHGAPLALLGAGGAFARMFTPQIMPLASGDEEVRVCAR